MIPLRFGDPGRELFGLYLAPRGPARPGGVVLCNPFGQEAIRAHRLYRVLAERLSRDGFHVLRFDYYGTGDSAGRDDEGDLETWTGDVRRASEELIRRSGCRAVSWFGLRLGATLALLAGAQVAEPPQRLVLWDPVVDGGAYLAELARAHCEARRLEFGSRWAIETRLRAMVERESETEALGFPLTRVLREQFAALNASSFAATREAQVAIVSSRGGADVSELERRLGADGSRVRSLRIGASIVWASLEAMNSALVPPEALREISGALGAA